MMEPRLCEHCTTPELCIVACPNNKILDSDGQAECALAEKQNADDQAVEIVFAESADACQGSE